MGKHNTARCGEKFVNPVHWCEAIGAVSEQLWGIASKQPIADVAATIAPLIPVDGGMVDAIDGQYTGWPIAYVCSPTQPAQVGDWQWFPMPTPSPIGLVPLNVQNPGLSAIGFIKPKDEPPICAGGSGGGKCVEGKAIYEADCAGKIKLLSVVTLDGVEVTPIPIALKEGACPPAQKIARKLCIAIADGTVFNVTEVSITSACGDVKVEIYDGATSPMTLFTKPIAKVLRDGECQCCDLPV
jgi:hypothetical protein